MRKEERMEVERVAKQALFKLVNSTRKHDELETRGYTRASSFIIRNARFMVTFAELAMKTWRYPTPQTR